MTLTSNSQFRVGDVIGQSFQTTFRNIVPFGILAIIAGAIMFVIYTLVSSIFGLSVMPMEPGMMEPGMAAPEMSRTVPVMVCAAAAVEKRIAAMNAYHALRAALRAMLFPSL